MFVPLSHLVGNDDVLRKEHLDTLRLCFAHEVSSEIDVVVLHLEMAHITQILSMIDHEQATKKWGNDERKGGMREANRGVLLNSSPHAIDLWT